MNVEQQETFEAYKRAVFLGSKQLGLNVFKSLFQKTPNLQWLIIHPDDELDERSNLIDFRNFAKEVDLEFYVTNSAKNTSEILQLIKPDIGVVCGWYWLLDKIDLEKIRGGLWGIHNSLLPRYRGGSPLVWSIIQGDEFVGSTIFKISDGLDNGPILHQIKFRMEDSDNISTVLHKIERILISEFPAKWFELISNDVELLTQDEENASYCGQRIIKDGLIDWSKSSKSVNDFIRALVPPYPCAFSFLKGERVEVLESKIHNGIFHGTPGQILKRELKSVVVSCGNNTAIEILKLRVGGIEIPPNQIVKSIGWRFEVSS
jgi:methionyl-tRNA formyltransferase